MNRSFQLTFTDARYQAGPFFARSRWRMALALAACDALCLLLTSTLVLFGWSLFREDLNPAFYIDLIPVVFLFLGVYLLSGLYSPSGLSPVEELQRLAGATTITFLGLGSLSFWFRNAESYSRASFLLVWLFSLFILPAVRDLLRKTMARKGLWGEAVALIGMGDQGHEVLNFLREHPQVGFRPVVLINGFGSHHNLPPDLPMIKLESLSDDSVGLLRSIRTAILIQPEIPEEFMHTIIEEYGFRFSQLILISNIQQFGSLWVTPCDIGGVLGLKINQNLISEWQQFVKRLLDIGVVVVLTPLLLPLLAFISVMVWFDSRGPIFYNHERIGRKGKRIRVWKFRTMLVDSDELLADYLYKNPALKKEWQASQKLKTDPRVTRVGRWLRKFSLDELPQVWNVFWGDMSLVGPRPIVDEEIGHYGSRFKTYLQVKPGLTGLWQISGRNNLDYPTRVRLDDYYVRNWSIWFDLYILARTPSAMLTGTGAY